MTSSQATKFEISISAVIFQEGDQYVAQGLEHDICAFGKTLSDCQRKFARAVLSNAVVCVDREEGCLDAIPKAPQKYWDMFEAAHVSVGKVEDEKTTVVQHHPAPTVRPRMRLLEAA